MVVRTACMLLVCLVAIPVAAFGAAPAVEWQSQFGGPNQQWAESVVPVAGGYLLAGSHLIQPGSPRLGGSYSYFLAKTDASGAPIWQKEFDLGYVSWGGNAIEAADGGFVMVGTVVPTASYSDYRIGLLKTDADGNLLWTRQFSENAVPYIGEDTYGRHVQQTSDGGYIVVGYHYRDFSVGSTIVLIRTDADGNELWRSTPGDDFTTAAEVRETADGGFIIGGDRSASDEDLASSELYLVKTDANGAREWSSTFGSATGDMCMGVRQTTDGGYVIHGEAAPYDDINGWGLFAAVIARTDASGNPLWISTWGGPGDERIGDVIQTADGGFVATGTSRSEDIGPDGLWEQMTVTRLSPSGERLWELLFGDTGTPFGLSYAEGASIEATADGGAIVGGMTVGTIPESDGWGDWEAFMVKLGPIEDETTRTVSIDVKPGSDVNPINLGAKGTLPVAVLTEPGFDASTLVRSSILFAGAGVAKKPNGSFQASLKDVDGDGDLDLMLHFRIADLNLKPGDQTATLTAVTLAGIAVEGSDRVLVKKCAATRKRR